MSLVRLILLVSNKTIVDLKYHADVLDLINAGKDSVMVVHGGGIYGDKEATIERWCKQYQLLPQNVRDRLVLENCEKCFSIEDCLKVSEAVNIPVVFDTHHYACYCQLHPTENFLPAADYMPRILESWKRRGIKPKFHVSEQGSGRVGHHSDYIEEIPNYLREIPEKYGIEIDIMIEAKMKEQAIFKLYEIYPEMNCKKDLCLPIHEAPGMGWINKHCVACECCAVKKKKKLKIVKNFM